MVLHDPDFSSTCWNTIRGKGRWALQVAQNVLSLAGQSPLRLYNQRKSDEQWNHVVKKQGWLTENDISRLANDPQAALQKMAQGGQLEELKKHFLEMANSPWTTLPSYPHPFFDEVLNRDWAWKVWLQFLMRHELSNRDTTDKPFHIEIMDGHMILACCKLNTTDQGANGYGGWLVAGPVFRPADSRTDGQFFFDERVAPAIKVVSRCSAK